MLSSLLLSVALVTAPATIDCQGDCATCILRVPVSVEVKAPECAEVHVHKARAPVRNTVRWFKVHRPLRRAVAAPWKITAERSRARRCH